MVKRKVRSAGRTSGSVEITLPVEMQVLEGIECNIVLRDGIKPEIIVQPDLSVAQGLFIELWRMLRVGLEAAGDIADFSLSDFNVGLFPPRHWYDRPPLSYEDALSIQACFDRDLPTEQVQQSAALQRLIAFLAVDASYRLGVRGRLAVAFGDAIGYLVTGINGGHRSEFEQAAALDAFGEGEPLTASQIESLSIDDEWQAAQDGLKRAYDLFVEWQERPGEYQAAKERWWRQRIEVETATSISTVEAYLKHGTFER